MSVESVSGTIDVTQWMPNLYALGYSVGHYAATLYTDSIRNTEEHTPFLSSSGRLLSTIQSWPLLYSQWWWDLVQTNPLHVLVETTLIVSIIYILLYRTRTDWRTTSDPLSEAEEEQLLREWKQFGRAPLTPASSGESGPVAQRPVIVHKVQGAHMVVETPTTTDDSSVNTTTEGGNKKEKDVISSSSSSSSTTSSSTRTRTVLNLATHDYLGLSSHPKVREAATQALRHYGCGSCGPRGFYGTMDVHLELEETAAKWLGTEGAILYSDGASCIASTIASFAKRGDLVVVDKACGEAIQTGVSLSRAHVKYFKHNDMDDLERLLKSIQSKDAEMGRKPNAQRRFLIAEAVYQQTGTICKLDALVALKHKYSYRLVLDETNAMGVLGPTGRGLTEACGLQRQHDVEITIWALEHAAGSTGGLTQGTEQVVEHQRLSGAGYCFSASSPPFTAVVATKAIQLIIEDAHNRASSTGLMATLQRNIAAVHTRLRQLSAQQLQDVVLVTSDAASPIQVLELADWPATRSLDQGAFWAAVVQEGWQHDVAWAASEHGLRWVVTSLITDPDITKALTVLEDAIQHVLDECLPPEDEDN